MKTSNLTILAVAIILFTPMLLHSQENDTTSKDIVFHYEDIANFREVLQVAKARGDTLQAMKDYFTKGSEGMKAWVERYGTTPEYMVKAVRYFPKYYEYLAGTDTILKKYEGRIADGLEGLRGLYPSNFVHIPPVYYFILFGGGGSVEMTANMICIDYFGYHEGIDVSEFDRIGGIFPNGRLALVPLELVPQVAIHETAHLLQSYIQGELDYVSIYQEENRSMKAYAIREGGADFLTYLGAGIRDEDKVAFGQAHERELWLEFEQLLDENPDNHPGWFSGKSEQHPEWPFQIGYYMGYEIVSYFYHTSQDKDLALRQILNAHSNEDFERIIETYRQKW